MKNRLPLSGISFSAGLVGLIGSYKNIVEIRFRTRHRDNMLIPRLRCDRLAISLKDPKAAPNLSCKLSEGLTGSLHIGDEINPCLIP